MLLLPKILLVIVSLWGAWQGYVQYQRFDAKQVVLNQLKQQTEKELARRGEIIDTARKNAERMADTIAATSRKNQEALKRIDDDVLPSATLTRLPSKPFVLGAVERKPEPAPVSVVRIPTPPARPAVLDAASVRLINSVNRRAPAPGAGIGKAPAKPVVAVRGPAAAPKKSGAKS